jgi:V/A-type H+/Na+-transporting ATPase subunit K
MKVWTAAVILATVMVGVLVAGTTLLWLYPASAAAAEASVAVVTHPDVARWAFASAAGAAALSALAGGYAVAQVGTAAAGALAEKPELFGRVLILVGLAEGIAIYGLIVAVLILNRVN